MFLYVFARLHNAVFAASSEEDGQTLVEYALIISLISIGSIIALVSLGDKISALFTSVGNAISSS